MTSPVMLDSDMDALTQTQGCADHSRFQLERKKKYHRGEGSDSGSGMGAPCCSMTASVRVRPLSTLSWTVRGKHLANVAVIGGT